MVFDLERLEVTTDPVPILEGVVTNGTGAADFDIAQDGSLVYVEGSDASATELVWVDRQGNEEPLPAPPRVYEHLQLSPDGSGLARGVRDQENDIWLWDNPVDLRSGDRPISDLDAGWASSRVRLRRAIQCVLESGRWHGWRRTTHRECERSISAGLLARRVSPVTGIAKAHENITNVANRNSQMHGFSPWFKRARSLPPRQAPADVNRSDGVYTH